MTLLQHLLNFFASSQNRRYRRKFSLSSFRDLEWFVPLMQSLGSRVDLDPAKNVATVWITTFQEGAVCVRLAVEMPEFIQRNNRLQEAM